MDNNIDEDDGIVIGLDLNHEPYPDSSSPMPPTPDEPETSQDGIVDRIRQLQAVTARANQSQQWRWFKSKPIVDVKNKNQGDDGVVKGPVNNCSDNNGGGEEKMKNCKRDISQLAKALETDSDDKKTDNGNFFDCNICLVMAKDPILTCCGHLFCSSCFDKVPYVDSISKECPTCEGEVTDSNITPVYGKGRNSR
ncbi:Zinc finger, RING/FYVE/PHD-type [Cynara cardunculus var. scolymus]|uniref:E3 ubiquitin-protein ligase RMA n=1 Tax=Cynara cardunculus var. scolymus TaxID=59895 RepID=A0A103Y175_CYNCS|nr:Zinc finger, RING/FYVE/PHD-type [Cynara cardunculus var. scolymus]